MYISSFMTSFNHLLLVHSLFVFSASMKVQLMILNAVKVSEASGVRGKLSKQKWSFNTKD